MGNNSQEVLIFSKEAMRFKVCHALHGGLACSRRVLLWTGVIESASPDRMDLSMDQYNLQLRKSSLWISGTCLYNQQTGIVLRIRYVFSIILASSPTHEHVVHEGAAVVCTAVQSGRSFQRGPGASTDLLGLLWSKESGSCFPQSDWQGCAGATLQVQDTPACSALSRFIFQGIASENKIPEPAGSRSCYLVI